LREPRNLAELGASAGGKHDASGASRHQRRAGEDDVAIVQQVVDGIRLRASPDATDSLVTVDMSTSTSKASISRQSAGTRSPAANRTDVSRNEAGAADACCLTLSQDGHVREEQLPERLR
jgi:hypothetical protein